MKRVSQRSQKPPAVPNHIPQLCIPGLKVEVTLRQDRMARTHWERNVRHVPGLENDRDGAVLGKIRGVTRHRSRERPISLNEVTFGKKCGKEMGWSRSTQYLNARDVVAPGKKSGIENYKDQA